MEANVQHVHEHPHHAGNSHLWSSNRIDKCIHLSFGNRPQCNSSGWSSPERGGTFGIVSYDWSNAKAQWAAAKPMDCEERLVQQAVMTKTANPASHVFVYRNVVKALPWFTTVREKLDDPNYSG